MDFNVTSTSPSFNATGVYLDATITAEFNKNILADSVSEMTVTLMKAETNELVPATITLVSSKKIQLAPASKLKGNTRYRVNILGSEWGVLSAASDTLPEGVSWGFTTGLYTDSADTEDEIPAGVDPAKEPTDEEIYLVSSIPDNTEVGVIANRVQLQFTGLVPSGSYLDVVPSHPLGYPASTNYWADNVKLDTDESVITAYSSGDLSTALDSRLALISDLPDVDDNAIIFVETGGAEGETRHVQFGIDPNFHYKLKVKVPQNEFTPTIEFSSTLIPRYITVEELRLFSGVSLNSFGDFVLDNMLHQMSKTAKQIWTSRGHKWPATTPYYIEQYVLHRTLRDMLAITIRDSGSESTANQRLGELNLRSDPDSKSLLAELRNLELMVMLFGQKIEAGNTGTKPISLPAWIEASKAAATGVMGANAENYAGQEHPRNRTDISRSIQSQTKRKR